MRAPVLLFVSIFSLTALGGACGGGVEVGPGPGDGGSSSSSGSSTSSSGASGSSSGTSSGGSSSGASSGGSGTSSGGVTCAPLPGCDSSVECVSPGGCGTCFCENGGWACTGGGCGDDVSDAGVCPLDPPNPGTLCESSGIDCSYGSAEGCGESCFCDDGSWECAENPCPPPVCSPEPPANGSLCDSVGGSCFYPTNNSCGGEEECDCDPSGTWDCYELGCVDAGPPDTGTGTFDSGSPCPENLPASSSACSTEGIVCSYFEGCEYNCLCASTGWVCAPEGPCSSPPPPGGG